MEELDDINEIINWSDIKAMRYEFYSRQAGNPAYPTLMMFRILLSQSSIT
jgi:hypothetical protein